MVKVGGGHDTVTVLLTVAPLPLALEQYIESPKVPGIFQLRFGSLLAAGRPPKVWVPPSPLWLSTIAVHEDAPFVELQVAVTLSPTKTLPGEMLRVVTGGGGDAGLTVKDLVGLLTVPLGFVQLTETEWLPTWPAGLPASGIFIAEPTPPAEVPSTYPVHDNPPPLKLQLTFTGIPNVVTVGATLKKLFTGLQADLQIAKPP